jgi:hypothetical protein
MVTDNVLLDKFHEHFDVTGLNKLWVHPHTRDIHVTAYGVRLKTKGAIPIKLGVVWAHFSCANSGLTSLHNAPHTVSVGFDCSGNLLTSLEHGPTICDGKYNCSNNQLHDFKGASTQVRMGFDGSDQAPSTLKSLEGLPTSASMITITYEPHLPLLRLIEHKRFTLEQAPDTVIQKILEKYQGQGKGGAIKAAAELARAGYKDNARW